MSNIFDHKEEEYLPQFLLGKQKKAPRIYNHTESFPEESTKDTEDHPPTSSLYDFEPPTPEPAIPTNTVTVFGFETRQAQKLIDFFKSLGPIKSINQTSSNWMTIEYSDLMGMKCALEKNATFFDGVMIGVVHGKDSNPSPMKFRSAKGNLDSDIFVKKQDKIWFSDFFEKMFGW